MSEIKGINLTWLSKTDLTNLNSGEGGSNFIDVKKYLFQETEFPYVSGQAMRFYLKESIRRMSEGDEYCVPNDKGETCGDVENCTLCDLFGYMSTTKGKGANVRVSPVKVAPSMGLLPLDGNSTIDFLTRKKPQAETGKLEGDIVNVEIGVNIYKCGVSIDIAKVGRKEVYDSDEKITKLVDLVDEDVRRERVAKLLRAIGYISDYSKQSRLLTDFTPDLICATVQDRYSHRLQKLFLIKDRKLVVDLDRVLEILTEMKLYCQKIYAGVLTGTIENESELKQTFTENNVTIKTPYGVLQELENVVISPEMRW